MKCIRCGKEYEPFCLSNFNLDLCDNCFEDESDWNNDSSGIHSDETVDKVTHKVTCPKCKRRYPKGIWGGKCKTKGCPVHFFVMVDDGYIYARWYDDKKKK